MLYVDSTNYFTVNSFFHHYYSNVFVINYFFFDYLEKQKGYLMYYSKHADFIKDPFFGYHYHLMQKNSLPHYLYHFLLDYTYFLSPCYDQVDCY